jgi:hypothetical protein
MNQSQTVIGDTDSTKTVTIITAVTESIKLTSTASERHVDTPSVTRVDSLNTLNVTRNWMPSWEMISFSFEAMSSAITQDALTLDLES